MKRWIDRTEHVKSLARVQELIAHLQDPDPIYGPDSYVAWEDFDANWLQACSMLAESDKEWLVAVSEILTSGKEDSGSASRRATVAAAALALAGGVTASKDLRTVAHHWSSYCASLGAHDATLTSLIEQAASSELRKFLQELASLEPDPGIAALVALATHLAGSDFPVARRSTVAILLDEGASGRVGSLTMELLHHGPPGLFPDMRHMWRLAENGEVAAAVQSSAHWYRERFSGVNTSIRYRLTIGRGLPTDLTGASIGAALGVCLYDLTRRRTAIHLPGRLLHVRASYAVTGGLSIHGKLLSISGYEAKLSAAAASETIKAVVAPAVDRRCDDAVRWEGRYPEFLTWASSVDEAYREVVSFRPRTVALGGVTILLLVALSVAGYLGSRASQAGVAELAASLALESREYLEEGDLRVGLQIAAESYRLNPSNQVRDNIAQVLASTRHLLDVYHVEEFLPTDVSGTHLSDLSVVGDADGKIRFLDVEEGQLSHPFSSVASEATAQSPITMLEGHPSQPILFSSQGNSIFLWDLTNVAEPTVHAQRTLDGFAPVRAVWSPDAHAILLSGSTSPDDPRSADTVYELSAPSLTTMRVFPVSSVSADHRETVRGLAYDLSGSRVFVATQNGLTLLDSTGLSIARYEFDQTLTSLVYSPASPGIDGEPDIFGDDPNELILGTTEGLLRWSIDRQAVIEFPVAGIDEPILDVRWGYTGDLFQNPLTVVSSELRTDRTRAWSLSIHDGFSVRTGPNLVDLPIAMSSDGAMLTSLSDRGLLTPHRTSGDEAGPELERAVASEDWIRAACLRAGASLSPREWAATIGSRLPYDPVCQTDGQPLTSGTLTPPLEAETVALHSEDWGVEYDRSTSDRWNASSDSDCLRMTSSAVEWCGTYGADDRYLWSFVSSPFGLDREVTADASSVHFFERTVTGWIARFNLSMENGVSEVRYLETGEGQALLVSFQAADGTPGHYHHIIENDGVVANFMTGRSSVQVDGTGVRGWQGRYQASDAMCCPSHSAVFRWERIDGNWRRRIAPTAQWAGAALSLERIPWMDGVEAILRADGIGDHRFGDPFENVLASLVESLGQGPSHRLDLSVAKVIEDGIPVLVDSSTRPLTEACWQRDYFCLVGSDDGDFVGWSLYSHPLDREFAGSLDGVFFTTLEGIGLGATVSELESILGSNSGSDGTAGGAGVRDWPPGFVVLSGSNSELATPQVVGFVAGVHRPHGRLPGLVEGTELDALLLSPLLGKHGSGSSARGSEEVIYVATRSIEAAGKSTTLVSHVSSLPVGSVACGTRSERPLFQAPVRDMAGAGRLATWRVETAVGLIALDDVDQATVSCSDRASRDRDIMTIWSDGA